MSIIVGDDRPVSPRVVPKLFPDMPSQSELKAARRGRSFWFVVAVAAIVLAIAGIAAAAYAFPKYLNADAAATRLGEESEALKVTVGPLRDSLQAMDGIRDTRENIDELIKSNSTIQQAAERFINRWQLPRNPSDDDRLLDAGVRLYRETASGDDVYWNSQTALLRQNLSLRQAQLERLHKQIGVISSGYGGPAQTPSLPGQAPPTIPTIPNP